MRPAIDPAGQARQVPAMRFEILGEISGIETFATGSGIREIARLRRIYGRGRWRKRKGIARVKYPMARSMWLSYTGMRRPGSVARNSRSSTCFEVMTKTQAKQLVVCVENDGYAASLEKRKIYVALRDTAADKHDMLRIIDESGEDYLYPKAFFRSIALPQAVKRAVLAA
jgi:hypothetical protein